MNVPSAAAVRRALPPAALALVDAVVREAERRELPVWLVGGPVRDLLLGIPLRDVDLLVEAHDPGTAEALAQEAAPPGGRVVAHGRFGTVRLAGAGGELDLATARRERYARPGALPDVEPGSVEEDLRRRDFTVNAMALALTPAARRGRPALLDPGGARADLEARRLRLFHPHSFHDDPTRALRAARLAPRLGFRLGRSARTALREALRAGAVGGVSGERYRREIEKVFADAALGLDPVAALGLLDEWHVLAALEPGLALPPAARAPLRRLGRALAAPPWPLERTRPWVAGLAIWLADLDGAVRRGTLDRLAVRGEAAERIEGHPKRRAAWRRALARARGRGAVDALLGAIDGEGRLAFACEAEPGARRRIARWALEDRSRPSPLDGSDLLMIGLEGPAVGDALARIRAAWLDGALADREGALVFAKELAARGRARAARRAPKSLPPSG